MSLKTIAALNARLSLGRDKIKKLADDAGDAAPTGKFANVVAKGDALEQAIEEFKKAGQGNDVDATFAAMEAATKACQDFEQAVAAVGGAAADAPPPASDGDAAAASALADDDKDKQAQQQMARDKAELLELRRREAARIQDEIVQKLAREMHERAEIEAWFVKTGRETPASVKFLSDMPIEKLRERKKVLEASPSPTVLGRIAPASEGSVTGGGAASTVTEDEITYVRARHALLSSQGNKLRPVDETLIRYQRHKQQQLNGAEAKKDDAQIALLSKELDKRVVTLASRAGLIMLASTPVVPFEEFGASSQQALQSFRLEYNISLASMPSTWAEAVGQMLPDGSMKTTYPISFDATEYKEKTGQNAATEQSQNADIEVKKREFYGAKQVELRRLKMGDFAYVQRWAQNAAELARARVFLRNALVTAILEAGTTGLWGVTAALPTGIDGQPFFSATHKVHPFDASRKLRGSATFANYQPAATPLNAANLTAEKNAAMQVAAPDGRELGVIFDGILYPSALEQTTKNLLTVQDLILDAVPVLKGVNNVMGQVRNPHLNSGMEMTRGADLAGTDLTANYYLYSREAIARGLVPWVIAEDPNEEIRLWDESSDFYKSSGNIKIESHVFLNAALMYPHSIRMIKGA